MEKTKYLSREYTDRMLDSSGRINTVLRQELESLFEELGCTNYRWISGKDIICAQWVQMKCEYGCDWYGKSCSCPPHVPPVERNQAFFREYEHVVMFHFEKTVEHPQDRFPWSKKVNNQLLKLERDVFLSGFQKAFVLFIHDCRRCAKCKQDKLLCEHPETLRPVPEGMGIDVFATARQFGLPIEVVRDYDRKMDRYAFLLVE
jgi:predicted metal-binding protein